MLSRLVAVCVVAHVCHLHLSDLMDAVSIVAVVIYRRHYEDRVKHMAELLIASHCLGKSVDIVEDRPRVVP